MINPLVQCFTFLLLSILAFAPKANAANEIVAALDDHLVAIDTGFSGSKVLLFGATQGEGDVVIVIRGPATDEIVRKKDRVFGVWANNEEVSFSGAPSFYSIISSKNIEDILPPKERDRLEMGSEFLNNYIGPTSRNISAEKRNEFWQALLRTKEQQGLLIEDTDPIKFLGNRLFRADFFFPANIPIGTYLVYVYLVKDQKVVSSQTTPLIVSKIGLEAEIYNFAHRHSFAYGIFAVFIALFAGWFASVIFRKK